MAKQDMGRLLPWLLALLLVLLLGGQARASGDGGDGEPPTLPRELLEAAPRRRRFWRRTAREGSIWLPE